MYFYVYILFQPGKFTFHCQINQEHIYYLALFKILSTLFKVSATSIKFFQAQNQHKNTNINCISCSANIKLCVCRCIHIFFLSWGFVFLSGKWEDWKRLSPSYRIMLVNTVCWPKFQILIFIGCSGYWLGHFQKGNLIEARIRDKLHPFLIKRIPAYPKPNLDNNSCCCQK